MRDYLKTLLAKVPGERGLYLARPSMAYYHHYMRQRGVELEPYVWVNARPDIALGGASRCSIGSGTFIPTTIQIRGADAGRIIIGRNCSIDTLARLHAANDATLTLEDNVAIGPYDIINAFADCTIRKNSMIGPYVNINCADHGMALDAVPMRFQPGSYAPVVIEEDVWVGSHVIILKGVHIGEGAVVAAGAVVSHDVDSFSIVAGVPAKVVGSRQG